MESFQVKEVEVKLYKFKKIRIIQEDVSEWDALKQVNNLYIPVLLQSA